jgi:hypothetical protein
MSSPAVSTAAAAPTIIYFGMDVHKDSVTIAVLPQHAKSSTHVDRLPKDLAKVKRYLVRVAARARSAAATRRAAPAVCCTAQSTSGACVRGGALADSEAPKRPAEARRARRREARALDWRRRQVLVRPETRNPTSAPSSPLMVCLGRRSPSTSRTGTFRRSMWCSIRTRGRTSQARRDDVRWCEVDRAGDPTHVEPDERRYSTLLDCKCA